MSRHPARRWIVLLALAGAALGSAPAIAQTSVPMEFPPPGAAMTEFPHPFARAAFGLTGVGR